jgi:TRAP-type mannitol/chloroaromatic compound transport system permease large subunit
MSIEWVTVLMFGSMLLLLALGLPLAFVTGLIGVVFTLGLFGIDGLQLVASRIYSFMTEYVLVAVPMFILMASLMERSGVAKDLFNAMRVWAGRLPGGLAMQTMVAATVMGAMTGIIGGEIVLLGLIALPQMLRLGYERKLAIGTICAGGSLGTMIPPSIVLIIYGLTVNVPIGDLFVATVIPGLLLSVVYLTYILVRCQLNPKLGPPAPPEERDMPVLAKIGLLRGLALPMLVIMAVLGTIYFGIASVTEAAGMLLWLSFGATAMIGVYNLAGGPAFIRELFTGLDVAPIVIILLMMLILVVLGSVMDWVGICLLTMPIFVPIVRELGYDPVWFGVLFCLNMQISYLTPPFGPAAFYLKGVAPPDITLNEIFAALWPFVVLQAGVLALVLWQPDIALWLLRSN